MKKKVMGKTEQKEKRKSQDSHGFSDISQSGFFARILNSIRSPPIIIITLLTFCGLVMRFYNITYNSLWLDEAATLNFAKNSLVEIWNITASGEFNPPLFHWIEHIMLNFGSSEFVLRFVPAIAGTFTIPLFFLIGKEMVDTYTGLVSAAILTFSPFHVFYSQDARAYTTVLIFTSLALYFYLRGLKSDEMLPWILFGIFSALAFWTHFYVFILIAILYIFAAWNFARKSGEKWKNLKRWTVSIGIYILFILPLILVTVHLFLVRTARPPTYGIKGIPVLTETVVQISGYQAFAAYLFITLFLLGMMYLWKRKTPCFILILLVLSVTFFLSIILSSYMPMIPRYLIFILPFYFTAIATSGKVFKQIVKSRYTIPILVIILVAINVPVLHSFYTGYTKENWRGMAQMMEKVTREGDVIVLLPSYIRAPFEYYYSNSSDGTFINGASNIGELLDVTSRIHNATIFYIVTGDISATEPSLDSVAYLQNNSRYMGTMTGIHVFSTRRS